MPEAVTAYSAAAHNKYRVSFIRLVIRALGVSFLSLVSLGMAFYAFIYMPQIRDLFFDIRYYSYQSALYWAGFYIIAIMFWAVPLAFCARLLLMQNFDVIGVDSQDRYQRIVMALPKLYVSAAFLSVLIGIYRAASDLPTPAPDDALQVRLSNYLSTHITMLFAFTALAAVLVFARNFIVSRYDAWGERLEKRRPERFHAILARFERLTRKHPTDPANLGFYLDELKPDFLSREAFIKHQRAKVAMIVYLKWVMIIVAALIAAHFLSYSDWVNARLDIRMDEWPAPLRAAGQTLSDTFWMKRAAFMPVLFGAWLPFAAFLTLLSNRDQFPYLASLIGFLIAVSFITSDGHDVRVLPLTKQEQGAGQAQLKFPEAVEKWKRANGWYEKGCDRAPFAAADAAAPAPQQNCPRPIIVAAEGGGSRAAFLTASVLGMLQDTSIDEKLNKEHKMRPFAHQLFGVSSVSGGSTGTALFLEALREHPKRPVKELEQAVYRQRLWFRNIAEPRRDFLHGFVTYKDALQATISNDFLSPVLIAYLARDLTAASRLPFVMDRAGVLETSWEVYFDGVYGRPDGTSAMQAPVRTLGPSAAGWSPVPVFNATSIDTGRRGLLTPLSATETLADGKFVFTDSYDINQLFCSNQQTGLVDRLASFIPARISPVTGKSCKATGTQPDAIDIRVSTAAGVSARSPVVSPHANIRDQHGQIADAWADGGYFDNSGAVTAYEMAVALKRIDSRLDPYVVQISSEPQWFVSNCESRLQTRSAARRMVAQQAAREEAPQLPNESDFGILGTWGDLAAVNATRVARSYETMVALGGQLENLNGKRESYSLIYVCPQPRENIIYNSVLRLAGAQPETKKRGQKSWKEVSLSWWLSPGLQAYLDRQLYAPYNQQELGRIAGLLRD